ncbi:hypothetical protein EUGRSUZ_H02281, partial [Eucalyptus grandis]
CRLPEDEKEKKKQNENLSPYIAPTPISLSLSRSRAPSLPSLSLSLESPASELGFRRVGRRGIVSPIASRMGGGNGQKAKMAREKNLEKSKGSKGSQLESNKKAMNIQCKICMQTFMCTTSEVKCREHAEAKHPKSDVTACFPHLKK